VRVTFELMAVPDLDPFGKVIGVGRGHEVHPLRRVAWCHVSKKELLYTDEPKFEVVVSWKVGHTVRWLL
jgi:hypothetical protein